MNLQALFKEQRELDERIVKEKGLEGQDLLPKKILALQVELGELANELRFFKFWSHDQKPRASYAGRCERCGGTGEIERKSIHGPMPCPSDCYKGLKRKDTVLEEFVDGLHFLLSIGLEINFKNFELVGNISSGRDATQAFLEVYRSLNIFRETKNPIHYSILVEVYLELGELLGFAWEQIEQAYMDKNKVNHARQSEGY